MITGTLINSYFFCRRKCYLNFHRISLEHESEEVKIGKALHEPLKNYEVRIKNMILDGIDNRYVYEYKKSSNNLEGSKMQLLYYLYELEKLGLKRDGQLIIFEKEEEEKEIYFLKLTAETKKKIENLLVKMRKFLAAERIPEACLGCRCKKCSYESYCHI